MFKRGACLLVVALLLTVLATVVGASQHVIISEVAWAGTQAGSSDEWIELFNPTDAPVDLTGWTLALGARGLPLGEAADPVLPPGGFFLLERTDDETVADVPADLVYTGALSNTGVTLRLLDADGEAVDMIDADGEIGWPAGTTGSGAPAYATMERVDPSGSSAASNWKSNDGIHRNGSDADGHPVNGTPKARNSATLVWESYPAVHMASPIEAEAAVTGQLVLSWTASDPDGPEAALHAAIFVSDDDGATWAPIVEGLVGTTYTWDTGGMPAGDAYRLRIAVTDGDGNTTQITSAAFRIAPSG